MTEFQAYVAGVVAGSLMRDDHWLEMDVEVGMEGRDYTGITYVTSPRTGERLRITVEPDHPSAPAMPVTVRRL